MADDTDETETTESKPSFDAAMDAAMNAAFDQIEAREKGETESAGTGSPPLTSPATPVPPPGGPPRATDGKFAKAAPAAAAPTAIPDQALTPAPGTAPPSTEAPQSWSADVKAKWAALPPDVQAYIAKREGEAHSQITQTGERLRAYEGLAKVIEPRRGALAASFGSVENAINGLFELSDFADRDFPGFVRYLAQQRGIDLSQLVQPAHHGQGAPVDPQLAALYSEVGTLKQAVQAEANARREAALAAANEEIAAFKAEKPHFAAVETAMAELIKSGMAKDLGEAYDKAVWANPETRSALLAEQERERSAKAEEEAKKRAAEAAKHRAINVTTKGKGVSPAPKASWEETMGSVYDRVTNAA